MLQKYEQSYDPQRGWLYREHWEGVSIEFMVNLQLQFVQSGIACRLAYELGKGVLETDDSTQEYTLDTWQLEGNSLEVNWLLNPYVQAVFNSLYPKTIGGQLITVAVATANLLTHIENGDSQTTTFADPTLAPFSGSQVYFLYPFVQSGLTSYQNDADGEGYILRHGTNVSNRYTVNIADFGVGQIYSTSQLLSEASNSGLWINPLSERLQYKIANVPVPTFRDNWMVGWKKSRSTENYAANNRDDIVTNYTYGQWSLALYQPY